jgi:hypothetical protein
MTTANQLRAGYEAKRKEYIEALLSVGITDSCGRHISKLTLTELQELFRKVGNYIFAKEKQARYSQRLSHQLI